MDQREQLVLTLLARGYDQPGSVNRFLKAAKLGNVTRSELEAIRMEREEDILALRDAEEHSIRHTGLARRAERVRRLTRMADLLEQRIQRRVEISGDATGVPNSWFDSYRQYIEAIDRVSDPMGISDPLDEDHPWVALNLRLISLGSDPPLLNSLRSSKLLESQPLRISSESPPPEQEKSSQLEESEQENPS